MKLFKTFLITTFIGLLLVGKVQADTQVVYYSTTVYGTQFLTKNMKKFITKLIRNRCPRAYNRAEAINVTKISFDDMYLDLENLVDEDGSLNCSDDCEEFISTEFTVNYKKELKLDKDKIRMTLAKTFLAEEMSDSSSLLSLVSLNSSGAVCR
jgi:hypothetical protein